VSEQPKVVLVTGASMGIGRAIAAHLAGRGFHVFGTSRQPSADALDGFALIRLDVTDAESVRACVETVIERAGRIDVLVNNAGVDMVGALEETSLDDLTWVMETNFYGVHRMVQAVLPGMRARRDGQIINISSGLGRAAFPFEGAYCASKFALEGYTEALRYELNIFNIRVSSVQPGFFRSNMINTQRIASDLIRDYDAPRQRGIALGRSWAEAAPEPDPVAHAVERIIRARRPRLYNPVGMEAVVMPPLTRLMPGRVLFKVGRWMLGLDDWRADVRLAVRRSAPTVGGIAAALLAAAALLGQKRRR
jgi:NAD(P)-dependent dehydrogenase (short-subunit alcohol dehydrogenase family)